MTSPHDPQRWRRISELFDRAIDLDESARAALLECECAGDPQLRDELERMLAADAADALFDQGAVAAISQLGTRSHADEDINEDIGRRLGDWVLERMLGRGGMGTVYAARRDDNDAAQRAAVKRLHRRWDGSAQAQRFLQERRILAVLSHPNIPSLIDHGLDGEGRPWFALELVEGKTLTDWADSRELDLRARIDLFRTVCRAVQYAHEHFVVHRDLKPSNVLVDGEGHPKVLDFGVAKRIDADAGATRTGAFAGFTPEYAAPEQISGGAITAATDVYALGVILYQLLSGRLPYAFEQDDLRAAAEAISAQPAGRLDQAITTGAPQEVEARLRQRATDARAFRRFVRGDLSRIVQTALAKEPPRRYASVQALSDDLNRFLEGRTVSVTGDTFAYRARKFVARNRWGVAMAALAVAALLAGTGFSMYRARAERIERERSEAVLAYVGGLFAAGTGDEKHANRISAVELLDRAAGRIDRAFPNDALGRAKLLATVGGAYVEMGLPERGEAYLRRSLAAALPYRERNPSLYLLPASLLADALTEQSRYAEVVALVGRELPFASERDRGLAAVLQRKRGWARSQLGELEQAEADVRQAIGLFGDASVPAEEGINPAYNDLAQIVSDRGRSAEALGLLRRVDAMQRRTPETTRRERLINRLNQGRELYRLGRTDEAIALLETTLPEMESLAGPANARVTTLRNLLSQAYAARGDYSAALREVERNLGALLGGESPPDAETVELTRLTQAKLMTYDGRAREALPMAQAGVEFFRAKYANPTVLRGRAQWILGETLLRLNRCAEAVPILEAALADEQAQAGATPTANAGEALDSLGRCRLLQGDAAQAQALLARAAAQFGQALGADNPRTLRSRAHWLWAQPAGNGASLQELQQVCRRLQVAAGEQNKALQRQIGILLREAGSAAGEDFYGLNSFS